MTWKTILSFIVSATVLTLMIGWLMVANLLPIQAAIDYSEAERSFVQIWLQVAIVIGLLLPGIAFLVWIRHPNLRAVFGFYLLVLAIQIVSEQIFSRVFSSSILVIIGTLYTAFRVWQLWQSQHFLRSIGAPSGKVGDRLAHGLL
ncbi:hypothetical protein QUA13_31485 [Microcoleus sp. S28C3]|uniref:hypothetical protein n=1 Tax=Microcoleus sp. S28C3 TaxID=3055414 RepID=UPI002FD54D7C